MEQISGSFEGCNKDCYLHYQYWLTAAELKGVLLVVHGLAEHCGRYANLVNYFVPKGYAIYSYDQTGHGKSQGTRGYIKQFSHFINDLKIFTEIVRSKHPNHKVFLIGHSVGGLISTNYIVDHPNDFDGLILSGATLKPGESVSAGLIKIVRLISFLFPKLGLYTIDASTISQDPSVVNAYINDPLVYRGKIRARLGSELIRTMQDLPDKMGAINLPLLIMVGGKDLLSNPEGSSLLYEKSSSKDKTLKVYDGYYHEIFNEPNCIDVFTDMEKWLISHE